MKLALIFFTASENIFDVLIKYTHLYYKPRDSV